jgi:hypothetical protein
MFQMNLLHNVYKILLMLLYQNGLQHMDIQMQLPKDNLFLLNFKHGMLL